MPIGGAVFRKCRKDRGGIVDSDRTTAAVAEVVDSELLESFLEETAGLIDAMEEKLGDLENQPQNSGLLTALFRVVHSMKGNTSLFGSHVGRTIAHQMENLLSFLKDNPHHVTPYVIALLFQGFALLKDYFFDIVEQNERKELSETDRALSEELRRARDALENNPVEERRK